MADSLHDGGCVRKHRAPGHKAQGRGRPRRVDHERLLALAGTMPDSALALEFNCARVWVTRLRKAAGIPAFDKLNQYLDLIGYEQDAVIAEMAGVQTRTVRARRLALGIEIAEPQGCRRRKRRGRALGTASV